MKESKRARSSSSTKKKIGTTTTSTTTTTFDVVNLLNQQDEYAEKQNKRRKYDIQRSKAAQSQMKIHNSLLECRILIQNPFNQINNYTNNNDIFSNMGDEDKSSLLSSCNQLLINLLDARKMLVNDEKSEKIDYQSIITGDNNDESDRDKKQRKEQQIADVINKEYINCRDHHWKEVLDRRHRDVRLHSGQITAKNMNTTVGTTTTQFKIMDSSFWEQVDSTVQYDIQRHRSTIRQQQEQEQNQLEKDKIQKYPIEWKFDDSKLYQQYVKDFVMNATGNGTNGGRDELSAAQERLLKKQQRKNASNMLASTKPIVDRKASKGRKIRYADISKRAEKYTIVDCDSD